MTVADQLRAARDLIAAPERWTQMAFAVDERGNHVLPTSGFACKWCAAGALIRATDSVHMSRSLFYLAKAAGWAETYLSYGEMMETVAEVNDRAGRKDRRPDLAHKAVMKMYDRAIELAEAARA